MAWDNLEKSYLLKWILCFLSIIAFTNCPWKPDRAMELPLRMKCFTAWPSQQPALTTVLFVPQTSSTSKHTELYETKMGKSVSRFFRAHVYSNSIAPCRETASWMGEMRCGDGGADGEATLKGKSHLVWSLLIFRFLWVKRKTRSVYDAWDFRVPSYYLYLSLGRILSDNTVS